MPAPAAPAGDEEDPILAATRRSLGVDRGDRRRDRRKRRARRDAAPAAAAAPPTLASRLWASRMHLATTVVGFGLGFAYYHFQFVEEFERGY